MNVLHLYIVGGQIFFDAFDGALHFPFPLGWMRGNKEGEFIAKSLHFQKAFALEYFFEFIVPLGNCIHSVPLMHLMDCPFCGWMLWGQRVGSSKVLRGCFPPSMWTRRGRGRCNGAGFFDRGCLLGGA